MALFVNGFICRVRFSLRGPDVCLVQEGCGPQTITHPYLSIRPIVNLVIAKDKSGSWQREAAAAAGYDWCHYMIDHAIDHEANKSMLYYHMLVCYFAPKMYWLLLQIAKQMHFFWTAFHLWCSCPRLLCKSGLSGCGRAHRWATRRHYWGCVQDSYEYQ